MDQSALKEGRKLAQRLVSSAKTNDMKYFVMAVDIPMGDIELIHRVMTGINENNVARTLGKLIFSAGDDKLVGYAHVPKGLHTYGLDAHTWIEDCSQGCTSTIRSIDEESVQLEITSCTEENTPFKLRDQLINRGIHVLRQHDLLPREPESDDENYAEAVGIEW